MDPEPGGGERADFGGVFADAAGENQRVDRIERGAESANGFGEAVAEDLDGQFGALGFGDLLGALAEGEGGVGEALVVEPGAEPFDEMVEKELGVEARAGVEDFGAERFGGVDAVYFKTFIIQ